MPTLTQLLDDKKQGMFTIVRQTRTEFSPNKGVSVQAFNVEHFGRRAMNETYVKFDSRAVGSIDDFNSNIHRAGVELSGWEKKVLYKLFTAKSDMGITLCRLKTNERTYEGLLYLNIVEADVMPPPRGYLWKPKREEPRKVRASSVRSVLSMLCMAYEDTLLSRIHELQRIGQQVFDRSAALLKKAEDFHYEDLATEEETDAAKQNRKGSRSSKESLG